MIRKPFPSIIRRMRFKLTMRLGLFALTCTFFAILLMASNLYADNSDYTLNRLHLPFSVPKSIWTAMSYNFQINSQLGQQQIGKEIAWFKSRQDYITELTRNAKPYLYYVLQQTRLRHMPAEIALMPMVESSYKPFQYSDRGAVGLWQMMPGTASGFGIHVNWWFDGRRDIIQSTNAALTYLTYLHQYFGNWLLAIAAYDSGEGTVKSAIRYNLRHHLPISFWALALQEETKLYIRKLLALAAIIRNPNKYHLKLQPLDNRVYFSQITMRQQISLAHAAELADSNIETIRELNPGFRRDATLPAGNYQLILPAKKAQLFETRWDHTKIYTDAVWKHHVVRAGDSLSKIAHQYHTKIATIEHVNNLKSDVVHKGESLIIPYDNIGINATITEDSLPGPKKQVHIVKNRDNLWTISARYRVTPGQLRYWNHLKTNRLHAGERLIIWQRHHTSKASGYRYKVRSGDSLSVIAKRFSVSTKAIEQLNHLKNSTIRLGQHLLIPH